MIPLTRRALLQSLTVGAGSFAFASASGEREASADVPTPRRLVIFPIANGVSDYPDIVADGSTATNFEFGRYTAPLDELGLRDQTVIIDNLEYVIPEGEVDYHFVGLTECLTAAFAGPNIVEKAASISLDRYIASKLGSDFAVSQVNMGTMCDSVTYSFAADGTPVPSNSDPLDIYRALFASLSGPAGPDPTVLRRLKRRQSVLDTVAKEVIEFQKRLGPKDRERAEAQLTAIREMEKRVRLAGETGPACTQESPALDVDYSLDLNLPDTMRAFIDLTVAGFACARTNVVLMHSFLREYQPPYWHCPWAPANAPNDSFHGLSHDGPGDNYASFARAKSFHFRLAGELANKLKAVPELGGTMLDHTIIFIPTEIGRGHTNGGLQFVTIGGGGLGVQTGRYMRVGGAREVGQGVPHQRLLVSLLNAMGIADTRFGEDPGDGPLAGYLKV